MKWTKELPTEEGWYWLYENNRLYCDYLELHPFDDGRYNIIGLHCDYEYDWVKCYFYGPIEPPKFEEKDKYDGRIEIVSQHTEMRGKVPHTTTLAKWKWSEEEEQEK